MTDDVLLKYKDLIEDLKSDLGTAKFDGVFKKKTEKLSKPDQFLLKMEMTRLSQPIARFIDLRGQVTGDVKPYEYKGKQHFMDALAIEVFEKAIKQYGDYTLAVYEAVMHTENNHKVMQQAAFKQGKSSPERPKKPQKKQVAKGHMVKFADYESRIEERMNYSIKVKVELSSENQVEAATSDISVSGCKLKLPVRYRVERGKKLQLHLIGLEQDFELGLKEGIQYEVIAIESVSAELNHIRMKRTFLENNSAFDDFLRSFIHGNKRRYKVNLDNTLEAVIIKGYEQYYLPRITSLFVFLTSQVTPQGQILQTSLALTNENNLNTLRYFNDESKHLVLASVLNQGRITKLLKDPGHVKECLLYCFTYIVKGKIYFYSATEYELAKTPNLKSLFLGFGSKKPSWRIFKIQLMPSLIDDAYIPLSLPDSAGEEVSKLNKPPSPRVEGAIKDIKYILMLTDITSQLGNLEYQNYEFNNAHANALKKFGHAKQTQYPHIDIVALEYVNLRHETRFLYKTAVNLEQEEKGNLTGHTRDFSENGLQIELEQPTHYENGDLLLMALPELQKITKKHQLNKLPYEVMAVSKTKTIINLRSYRPTADSEHIGTQFFTQLIDKNKSKLKSAVESPKIPGLSTALRNMVTKNICQFPFYVHKKGTNITIGAIGHGLYPSPLHLILGQFGLLAENFNLDAFFSPEIINDILLPSFKPLKRQDPPLELDMYLRFNPRANDIETAVLCDYLTQEKSNTSKKSFIAASIKKDLFFAFRIYLSRTGRPDTEYLSKELSYISQYAMHKAKVLEEELWSVMAVGDLIDISDELLIRYNLDPTLCSQMKMRKMLWTKRLN